MKIGQSITQAEAERMLEQDLWEAGRFANTIEELNTQGRYDAVVDFCFNLGVWTDSSSRRCTGILLTMLRIR